MAIQYNGYSGWNDRCPYCGLTYCNCYRNYPKQQAVTPKITLEEELRLVEKRQAELLATREKAEKYGSDSDYDVDDSILFHRTYSDTRKKYTWVAVKVCANKWFITGRNQNSKTFEELVYEYLVPADDVWVCKLWEEI